MVRKLAACLLMIALVTAWPASGVYAQAAPASAHAERAQSDDRNQKNNQPSIGFQAGQGGPSNQSTQSKPSNHSKPSNQSKPSSKSKPSGPPSVYSRQVGPVVTAAFDRAMGEIDASSPDMSPTDVKNATFRRRLLELRLLMDLNSFAYNHDQLKAYRDIVDNAYQAIGDYQDVSVIEKEVDGLQVPDDIVNARHNAMNQAMDPLRDQDTRNQMRAFLSEPLPTVRTSRAVDLLWTDAEARGSDSYDEVGNAALLEASILRHMANEDIGVTDIFNADQKIQFHAIRKELRSVLVLASLLPDTNDAIQGTMAPLANMVSQYGDANDAYTAWDMANQVGSHVDDAAANLSHQFDQAQDAKNQVIDGNTLNVVAQQLEAVRDAHRV